MLLLLSHYSAKAHDSNESRIDSLEQQLDQLPIQSSNESVALILQRADLHRRQLDWDAARLDYDRVAKAAPNNIVMMQGKAQLHLDQHQYEQAAFWARSIQRIQATDANAGLLHARALAGMGDFKKASAVYGNTIKQLDQPKPEHYIEHAQMIMAAEPNSNHTSKNKNASTSDTVSIATSGATSGATSRAITSLDHGADVLGNPVSLHEAAYTIELNSNQLDAALQRIEKVLSRNNTLLNWRLKRAELLLELGRISEARHEALCLIDRIQKLSGHRRGSRAFQVIKNSSESLLERIKVVSKNHAPQVRSKASNQFCDVNFDCNASSYPC